MSKKAQTRLLPTDIEADDFQHGLEALLSADSDRERKTIAAAFLKRFEELELAEMPRNSFVFEIGRIDAWGYLDDSVREALQRKFIDFLDIAKDIANKRKLKKNASIAGKKGAGKPRLSSKDPIRTALVQAMRQPKREGETLLETMRNWCTSPPDNLIVIDVLSGGYRVQRVDEGDEKEFQLENLKRLWSEAKHP